MDYWDKKLLRKQISSKLEPLKMYATATTGITVWVKTIREALGMTLNDLANRTDMDKAQLSRIEKTEQLKHNLSGFWSRRINCTGLQN